MLLGVQQIGAGIGLWFVGCVASARLGQNIGTAIGAGLGGRGWDRTGWAVDGGAGCGGPGS